jgi:hypothetical protein
VSYQDSATIAAVLKQEREERMPFIVPEEFWIDYETQADGSTRAVEWVRWVKKGMQNPATIVEKISRLSKPAKNGQVALEWQVLKSYYDSWKSGQSAPIDGTPLAAWPGATPQLVKALTPCNIRSVEDLAEMEDAAIARVSIPGLRDKQKQAKAFLEAKATTAGVSAELVELRDKLESRDREVQELRELIEKFAIKKDEADEAPKRRGRPPKQTEAA